MSADLLIEKFVALWPDSPFGREDYYAWQITQRAAELVGAALSALDDGYGREGDIAVHRTATIENGAVLKGPAIIGPGCFLAAGAYLRGGVFLDEGCIIGPGCELKSSFLFKGATLAHFNFVGDSILGADVNLEAGAIIANHRNEWEAKAIRFVFGGGVVEPGVEKFGALVGDHVRVGANAVIAPGAIIGRGTTIPRLTLVDQAPGL
ncbi:LpxA family transferase [Bosea sp. 2RAB26]|uniref:LpxA family transferase n=1 Tax=Bosea sp. 2RAB26 TaxID=3237476 RepID=UPI003F8E9ECE